MNTPLYTPGEWRHPFGSGDPRCGTLLHTVGKFDVWLPEEFRNKHRSIYVVGPADAPYDGLDFNRMDASNPGAWLFNEPKVPDDVTNYVVAMVSLHS